MHSVYPKGVLCSLLNMSMLVHSSKFLQHFSFYFSTGIDEVANERIIKQVPIEFMAPVWKSDLFILRKQAFNHVTHLVEKTSYRVTIIHVIDVICRQIQKVWVCRNIYIVNIIINGFYNIGNFFFDIIRQTIIIHLIIVSHITVICRIISVTIVISISIVSICPVVIAVTFVIVRI